jgi:hypothetical protein
MARLSAYGRTVVLRLEKETVPTEPSPWDITKVTYCFMSDRRILIKISWHYKGSEVCKPKWDSSGYKVRGSLKDGIEPKNSRLYKKLIAIGYHEADV